jgi:hypothetical protein
MEKTLDRNSIVLEVVLLLASGEKQSNEYVFGSNKELDSFLLGFYLGRDCGGMTLEMTAYEATSRKVEVPGGAAQTEVTYDYSECDCDYGTAHCPHKSKKKLVVKNA